ncbi:hypothetical protein A0J61_00859 [Choanephora cucurbitarum]|uniref:Uncharacterized protein n=1 Tax=Choanephora cucurbitarum TaxID=101091 RepID=A0A1C7NQB5_9FUNG|nr:hypothetical protein A0J61_00859 [Choanephora cucurbitarum]
MSAQLREPIRSLRHISVKPWPFFSHTKQRLPIPRSHIQGSTNQQTHKWPLILSWINSRSYSTFATTARSFPNEEQDVGCLKSDLSAIKRDKSLAELWQDYQTIPKDSFDMQALEALLIAVSQNTKQGSKRWLCLIRIYEDFRQLCIRPSITIYRLAMSSYGHTGNATKVNSIFREYKRHYIVRPVMYRHYISALIQTEDLSAAVDAFRDINSSSKLDTIDISYCLANVVTACSNSKKHKSILMAMRLTDDLYQRSSIQDWSFQASDQIATALWRGYSRLFKLKRKKLSTASVEALFHAYAEALPNSKHKAFRPSHLFILFDLICRQKGFVPSIKTCNFLLDVQSRYAHPDSLKNTLAWMQKFNLEPNSVTVSILLKTFGTRIPISQTQQLYRALKQQDIEEPGQDINLDVCKAFINVFTASSAKMEQAKTVVSDVKRSGYSLDSQTYMVMAQGFTKRNEVNQCLKWLQEEGCQDLDSYAVVLEGRLSQGEWKRCEEDYQVLVKQFDQDAVDGNRRIVKALLTAKLAQDKSHDCQQMLKPDFKMKFTPNTVMRIIDTLIHLETKSGHPLVHGSCIVKSLKVLESSLGIYLDGEGISRVILGLGRRGDCEHAFQVYNWVRENGVAQSLQRCGSPSIYRAMMLAATENSDVRKVERAWVDMQYRKQFYKKCNHKELHQLATYNFLLNAFASQLPQPDITRLKRAFKRLIKQNLEPDLVTYNIMIKAFVNADNMQAAEQIYRKMLSQNEARPDEWTVNTMLNGWIRRKDWAEVEKFVKELKHNGNLNMVTFNLLIQSFLQLDSRTMAQVRLYKHKNRWDLVEAHSNSKLAMSSEKIWDIFESATGYSKSLVAHKTKHNLELVDSKAALCNQLCNLNHQTTSTASSKEPTSQFAFIKLFSNNTEANQVTYKLFMKAFTNVGDSQSASRIQEWMQYRLSL